MKIGIIGSGSVGQALGAGFATLGHQVKIGSREPGKLEGWMERCGPNASAGSPSEAATFGDMAVVATAWAGTQDAIDLAGPANLAGKVVLDTTNPLVFADGTLRLAVGHTDSAGEQVQRWLPQARVVKAFNTVGNELMFRPQFPGGPPDMFICGDDVEAKAAVPDICREFGWGVIDMGDIEAARLLEPLGLIWISHAFRSQTRDHAWKFLRK